MEKLVKKLLLLLFATGSHSDLFNKQGNINPIFCCTKNIYKLKVCIQKRLFQDYKKIPKYPDKKGYNVSP